MAVSDRTKRLFPEYYKKKETEKNVKLGDGPFAKQFDLPTVSANSHYFLAEETLVPRLRNSDTQRINMFASHFTQTVQLVHPEYPHVFTNFEDQVGEYSIACKKASDVFTVIAKLSKNALNYDLIIQYNQSKVYDVIHYHRAEHITEDYGYAKEDCLAGMKEGDVVPKGAYLYRDSSHDADGNFCYGVNLKACYIPWKGKTYEDAVVVSESAAKKLTSYKVEQINVSVNGNAVMLNLYGKNGEPYKAFPNVGDATDGNVLAAIRQVNSKSMLYDFKFNRVNDIVTTDDITYTEGGIVADIDYYCNIPMAVLEKRTDAASSQLIAGIKAQAAYYEACREAVDKILPVATMSDLQATMNENDKTVFQKEKKEFGFNWTRPCPKSLCKNKYTEEFGYFWKQVHEYLDGRIKWKTKGGLAFNNIRMKFLILKENPLSIGAKLTGRYGNKGVVSDIIPDAECPVSKEGVRAEILLNPLGVLNRMNPSQIIEQHINFISDHIISKMKSMRNLNSDNALRLYLSYVHYLNADEEAFLKTQINQLSSDDKTTLVDEIIANGIYIHQAPFWNLPDEKAFAKIEQDHPDWCTKYQCTFDSGRKIENPLVIGDMYMLRLKHESSGHFSVISDTSTNIKGQPSKTELKKKHKILISESPIRLGDMETTNLLLTKRGDTVSSLFRSYSSSKEQRLALAEDELTYKDPINIDVRNAGGYSIARNALDRFLSIADLCIVDDPSVLPHDAK